MYTLRLAGPEDSDQRIRNVVLSQLVVSSLGGRTRRLSAGYDRAIACQALVGLEDAVVWATATDGDAEIVAWQSETAPRTQGYTRRLIGALNGEIVPELTRPSPSTGRDQEDVTRRRHAQ